MKLAEAYAFRTNGERTRFTFVSEGPKGQIVKLVEIVPTSVPGLTAADAVYNLALGDRDAAGELDDQPVTNNGDAQRVLLTVAAGVYFFTERHDTAQVYIAGGTPARTRLYQMGIARALADIEPLFDIYGRVGNQWQRFQPGVAYRAFLVRRKALR